MSASQRVRRDYREEILNELRAIDAWDRDFFLAKKPDEIEFAAWEARRMRVVQIVGELSQTLNRERATPRVGPADSGE